MNAWKEKQAQLKKKAEEKVDSMSLKLLDTRILLHLPHCQLLAAALKQESEYAAGLKTREEDDEEVQVFMMISGRPSISMTAKKSTSIYSLKASLHEKLAKETEQPSALVSLEQISLSRISGKRLPDDKTVGQLSIEGGSHLRVRISIWNSFLVTNARMHAVEIGD